MEPRRDEDVQRVGRRLNPTIVALVGGLIILLLLVAYFATRDTDQDKLTGAELNQEQTAASTDNACARKATYDLIKRDLFQRAAQIRGSDQETFDKVAGVAVVRMENAVMESQDSTSGAVNCSGQLSLDLPPGVSVNDGRRTLTSSVDYTLQPGGQLNLNNADAIIGPLATLTRVEEPQPETTDANEVAAAPEPNVADSESAAVQPGPPSAAPGRPSFNCANARSRGEVAVCSDSGLSALDVNMSTQYRRALGGASPEQRAILQSTRDRFLAYRDRCTDRQCIGDAYVGRMREIRDIMEGRWQAQR